LVRALLTSNDLHNIKMSNCALNAKPNKDGSCLAPEHVSIITKYADGNTLAEVKAETQCTDDECILEKVAIPDKVKSVIEREAFKAPATSFDHNYWLNNTEVDTVMSHLRRMCPGFAHGFIHMIDLKAYDPANIKSFDYPVYAADETDFANEFKHALIQRGLISGTSDYKPKLSTYNNVPLQSYGLVCNTDSSKGSGQHWFAIHISSDQKDPENTSRPWIRIELFNSSGGGATNHSFNDFWQTQAMKIGRATGVRCTFDIITNLEMQSRETGNCGSYSLFYHYSRLKGVHPAEFDNPNKMVKDYSMQKFRKVCFRLEESLF